MNDFEEYRKRLLKQAKWFRFYSSLIAVVSSVAYSHFENNVFLITCLGALVFALFFWNEIRSLEQ